MLFSVLFFLVSVFSLCVSAGTCAPVRHLNLKVKLCVLGKNAQSLLSETGSCNFDFLMFF